MYVVFQATAKADRQPHTGHGFRNYPILCYPAFGSLLHVLKSQFRENPGGGV